MPLSSRCTMPGRVGSPTVGDLGVAGQEPVHERARCAARAGVHDQPGGLVDDEQVVVLVHDRERRRRARARPAPLRPDRGVDLDDRRPSASAAGAAW